MVLCTIDIKSSPIPAIVLSYSFQPEQSKNIRETSGTYSSGNSTITTNRLSKKRKHEFEKLLKNYISQGDITVV